MIDSLAGLSYAGCRDLLDRRLSEPAPGRIQLLTGPRQVGKTTLLLAIAEHFGTSATYAAGDAPEAGLPGFWERLWEQVRARARETGRALLLLDEVHHLARWSERLKSEWDRVRRERLSIHVVASGSSSLRIGTGSRETLAGRFERITLSHWAAADLADAFAIPPRDAARLSVMIGTYPGAFALRGDPARWAAYVRDAIAEPAVGRDLLHLEAVRRPALLRQTFGLAVASPAQIVALKKLQGQLADPGALATIAHYLDLLDQAYLVAPLGKYTTTAMRRRAAPPKLITLNNALLTALSERGAPDRQAEPERFGHWLENACLAHAVNRGQRVSYWREEPLEVDAVVEGSWGHWAVEVKTGRFDVADLRGVLELTRRFPRLDPLVVCDEEGRATAARAGLPAMAWEDFLLVGPRPG